MLTQVAVKFTPIKDIVKKTNGQKNLHFFANKPYLGVKYFDGSIVACSPISHKTMFIDVKMIKIH